MNNNVNSKDNLAKIANDAQAARDHARAHPEEAKSEDGHKAERAMNDIATGLAPD
jgi:hypothetical protein